MQNKFYTLGSSVVMKGKALHTGNDITCTITPSQNPWITFKKEGWKKSIPALYHHIQTTPLNTMLQGPEGNIHTIEHLMCAFSLLHITHVEVSVSNAEVPILDGSVGPWIEALQPKCKETNHTISTLSIQQPLTYEQEDCVIKFLPHPTLMIQGTVEFPVIGKETYTYNAHTTNIQDFIWAKTFGYMKDLQTLQEKGLALGIDENNTVGITDKGIYNPAALSYPNDNFIRHKMLDFIGDIYTTGTLIQGHIQFYKTGHKHTNQALKTLFKNKDNFQIL